MSNWSWEATQEWGVQTRVRDDIKTPYQLKVFQIMMRKMNKIDKYKPWTCHYIASSFYTWGDKGLSHFRFKFIWFYSLNFLTYSLPSISIQFPVSNSLTALCKCQWHHYEGIIGSGVLSNGTVTVFKIIFLFFVCILTRWHLWVFS